MMVSKTYHDYWAVSARQVASFIRLSGVACEGCDKLLEDDYKNRARTSARDLSHTVFAMFPDLRVE